MDAIRSLKSTANDLKNRVMAKDETEKRVYDAIANVTWGASTSLLNEITRDSFDNEKYSRIMKIIWTSLEDPSNSRVTAKCLTLLDYLVKNGCERVVEDCRQSLHKIRLLENYRNEDPNDRGSGVAEKAKQLRELLSDNGLIREERQRAREIRDKISSVSSTSSTHFGGFGNSTGQSYGSSTSGFGSSSYDNSTSYSESYNSRNQTYNYSNDSSKREKYSSYDQNSYHSQNKNTTTSNSVFLDTSSTPHKKKTEVGSKDKSKKSSKSSTGTSKKKSSKHHHKDKHHQKEKNETDLLGDDNFVLSKGLDQSSVDGNSTKSAFDNLSSVSQNVPLPLTDPFSMQNQHPQSQHIQTLQSAQLALPTQSVQQNQMSPIVQIQSVQTLQPTQFALSTQCTQQSQVSPIPQTQPVQILQPAQLTPVMHPMQSIHQTQSSQPPQLMQQMGSIPQMQQPMQLMQPIPQMQQPMQQMHQMHQMGLIPQIQQMGSIQSTQGLQSFPSMQQHSFQQNLIPGTQAQYNSQQFQNLQNPSLINLSLQYNTSVQGQILSQQENPQLAQSMFLSTNNINQALRQNIENTEPQNSSVKIQSQQKNTLGGLVNLDSLEVNKPKDNKSTTQPIITTKSDRNLTDLNGFSSRSSTIFPEITTNQSFSNSNYPITPQQQINQRIPNNSIGQQQQQQQQQSNFGISPQIIQSMYSSTNRINSTGVSNSTTNHFQPPLSVPQSFNSYPINNSGFSFQPIQTFQQQGNFYFPQQSNFGF